MAMQALGSLASLAGSSGGQDSSKFINTPVNVTGVNLAGLVGVNANDGYGGFRSYPQVMPYGSIASKFGGNTSMLIVIGGIVAVYLLRKRKGA